MQQRGLVRSARLALALLASTLCFVWALYVGLARSDSIHPVLLVLPWLGLLRSPIAAARSARQMWQSPFQPALVAAGLLMLCWLLGAGAHAEEWVWRIETAITFGTWIPIAILLAPEYVPGRRGDWLRVVAAGAALALGILFAYAFRDHVLRGVARPAGAFPNVVLGPYACALAAFVASVWSVSTVRPGARIGWVSAALCLGVAIAGMTGAKISLIVTVTLAAAVALAWHGGFKVALLATVLAALAFIGLQLNRWTELLNQLVIYEDVTHKTSFGARFDVFIWGWRHFREVPVFGWDRAQLLDIMNNRFIEFDLSAQQIYRLDHMHNDFLQITYTGGMQAGLAWLVMTGLLIRGLIPRRESLSGERGWSRFAGGMTVMVVVAFFELSLVDSFVSWPRVLLAQQLLLGGCVALTLRRIATV